VTSGTVTTTPTIPTAGISFGGGGGSGSAGEAPSGASTPVVVDSTPSPLGSFTTAGEPAGPWLTEAATEPTGETAAEPAPVAEAPPVETPQADAPGEAMSNQVVVPDSSAAPTSIPAAPALPRCTDWLVVHTAIPVYSSPDAAALLEPGGTAQPGQWYAVQRTQDGFALATLDGAVTTRWFEIDPAPPGLDGVRICL
jgi:hypothetical protein